MRVVDYVFIDNVRSRTIEERTVLFPLTPLSCISDCRREIEGLKDKVLQLEEEIEDDGERPRKG